MKQIEVLQDNLGKAIKKIQENMEDNVHVLKNIIEQMTTIKISVEENLLKINVMDAMHRTELTNMKGSYDDLINQHKEEIETMKKDKQTCLSEAKKIEDENVRNLTSEHKSVIMKMRAEQDKLISDHKKEMDVQGASLSNFTLVQTLSKNLAEQTRQTEIANEQIKSLKKQLSEQVKVKPLQEKVTEKPKLKIKMQEPMPKTDTQHIQNSIPKQDTQTAQDPLPKQDTQTAKDPVPKQNTQTAQDPVPKQVAQPAQNPTPEKVVQPAQDSAPKPDAQSAQHLVAKQDAQPDQELDTKSDSQAVQSLVTKQDAQPTQDLVTKQDAQAQQAQDLVTKTKQDAQPTQDTASKQSTQSSRDPKESASNKESNEQASRIPEAPVPNINKTNLSKIKIKDRLYYLSKVADNNGEYMVYDCTNNQVGPQVGKKTKDGKYKLNKA